MASKAELDQVKAVIVQASKDIQNLKETTARQDELLTTFSGRVDEFTNSLAQFHDEVTTMDKIAKDAKSEAHDTAKHLKSIHKLFETYREMIISDINSGALAQRIESLERRFDKVRHSVADGLAEIEKAKNELAEERAAVEKMHKRVKSTKSEFEDRIKQVDSLEQENAKLKKEIDLLKTDAANSQTRAQETSDALTQLSKWAQDQVSSLLEKNDQAQAKADEVFRKANELSAMSADLQDFRAFKASVQSEIQNTKDGMNAQLKEKAEEINSQLQILKQKNDELITTTETLTHEIEELKRVSNSITERIDGVAGDLKSGLNRTRGKAKKHNQKVNTLIEDLNSKEAAVEQKQTEILDALKLHEASIKELKRMMKAGQEELENKLRGEAARAQKAERDVNVICEEITAQAKASFEEVRSKHAALASTVNNNQKTTMASIDEVKNSGNVRQDEMKTLVRDYKKETERILANAEQIMEEMQAKVKAQIKESEEATKKQIGKIRAEVVTLKGGEDVDFPKLVLELKGLHGRFTEAMDKNEDRMKRMRTKLSDVVETNRAAFEKELGLIHEEIVATKQSVVEEMTKLVKEEQARSSGADSEIEALVAKLGKELESAKAEIKERFGVDEQNLSEFQQDVKGFVKQSRVKQGELQKGIEDVREFAKELSDSLTRQEEVALENVRSLKNSIRSTREKVEGAFQAIREEDAQKFMEIKTEFLAQKDFLKKLSENIIAITSSLEKHDTRFDNMETLHDKAMKELHTTMAEEMRISMRDLAAEVERVRQSVDQFKGDTEFDLPSLIESLKTLKKKMSASVDQADERMKKLKARVEAVLTEFTTAEQAQLAELRTEIGQSEQMVKSLVEKSMKSYQDEINDSMAQMAHDIEKTKSGVLAFVGDGKIKLPVILENFSAFQCETVEKIKTMRKEMQSMKSEIRDGDAIIRKSVEDTTKECHTLVDNLNTKIGATSDELKHLITVLNDKSKERINSVAEDLETIRGGSKLTLPKLLTLCTELKTSLETAKHDTDHSITSLAKKIQTELSKVYAEIEHFSGNAQISLADAAQSIDALRNTALDMQNRQTEHTNAIIAQMKELRKQNQTAIAQTNGAIATLEDNTNGGFEKMKQFVERKHNEAARMIESASAKALAASEQVQQNTDSRIDALGTHINDTVKKIKESHDEVKRLGNSMTEDLRQVMRKQQVLISDQDGRDAQIMQQVKIQLSKFQTKMTESYQAAISDMQLSLETIKDRANERSSESPIDAESDIRELKLAVSQIRGGSKLSIAAVVGKLDELRNAIDGRRDADESLRRSERPKRK